MQLLKEIQQQEIFLDNIVNKTLQFSEGRNCSIEVVIRKTIGVNVNIRKSILENVEYHNDGILFITVYNRFSKGSVSSKDFSLHGIQNMLDKALSIAEYSASDFFSGLPDSKLLYSKYINLDLFHPWEFDIKRAIELAQVSEKTAFKHDNRIVNSEGSFFNSQINIIVFGNSLGMLEKYKSTCHSIYTCMIAEENNIMQRDFDYSIARKIENLEKSENIGRKSAIRAVARLGSKKIKTTKSPVIFSASLSSSFFTPLASAINGNNVYQKSTFLINQLKKRIFPDWLNIQEDPHIEQGLGSKPFDNEGVATYTKYIVKNGVLETWLLNSYMARKLHLISTGNAGGIYNWLITCKKLSFLDLIKEMYQGLFVTELMGQGVDIVSGHYSRGAVGFWVEKGEIKYPVNEITISGNLSDMWNNVVSISNDVDIRNNIRCGSVLVSEMQISGE